MKKQVFGILAAMLAIILLFSCAAAEEDPVTGYPIVPIGGWQTDTEFTDSNGGRDPIEWLVLTNDGKKALLLSRYILTDTNFNYVYGNANGKDWAKCTLRKWLNGDFFSNAFSKDEQKAILQTQIKNPAGPETKTKGSGSKDKVFLLSYDELQQYLPGQEQRAASRTAFADAVLHKGTEGSISPASWWLRTPGMNNNRALLVDTDGSVELRNGEVIMQPRGVRPAIWVDVKKAPLPE